MPDTPRPAPIEWEFDVPLLTNRYFLGGFAKAMIGSGVLVVALVTLGLGVQGEWRAVLPLAGMLLAISGALFLLGLLLMAFPFRNRTRTRFTVDGEGARLEVVDRVARATSRGAILLGVVLGSGSTAGSGLLAATQEHQGLRWSGAFRAIPEPATRTIAFRNGWRTLLRVYCTPAGYDETVAAVRAHMSVHGSAERAARSSPLGAYLLRTAVVVIAMLPVFAARDTFGYGLLAPWILLCFALSIVWLVRPLAWVVLLGEVVILGMAVAGAGESRRSSISGETYRRWEVLSGDGWALGALMLAGLAVVGWLAVGVLRGSVQPALQADDDDAGGEA